MFPKHLLGGRMLRKDRIHESLPAGYLGQDCQLAHALLLLPSGFFCQSLTVTAKHSCSPTPSPRYTTGREGWQPAERELTFVLIGVTRVNLTQPLPTPSAFDERRGSEQREAHTLPGET